MSKVISFFGQASYSIYLFHPLVAIPVIAIFNKLGLDKPSGYILSFFLVFAVSWVTFKYIELSLMKYGKNI